MPQHSVVVFISCQCFFYLFFLITLSTISEASITTIKAAMMINERLIFKTRGTCQVLPLGYLQFLQVSIVIEAVLLIYFRYLRVTFHE